MKTPFIAHWGPHQRKRPLLFLVSVLVFATGMAQALAEDGRPIPSQAEIEEMEREIEQMDQENEIVLKDGGPITCGSTYCRGLYDDLISYTWLRDDGYAGIRVSAAVEPFLEASSENCTPNNTIYTAVANQSNAVKRETSGQWIAQLQIARAMGHEIQLKWEQYSSSWPVCFMERVYIFGPPAS